MVETRLEVMQDGENENGDGSLRKYIIARPIQRRSIYNKIILKSKITFFVDSKLVRQIVVLDQLWKQVMKLAHHSIMGDA